MAVLAEPITRLVYQRGHFGTGATDLVAEALVWWSISLPFQGISLLFTRTFFGLQKPWATTALFGLNMGLNAAISGALYSPLGVKGVVLGTVVGTIVMCVSQGWLLRRDLHGVEAGKTLAAAARMLAAAVVLAAASYGVWHGLDSLLGRSLGGQIASVGGAITAGVVVYGAGVWVLGVPEARQIRTLLPGG
jgi:putative peptidoglycan lipid II flippase